MYMYMYCGGGAAQGQVGLAVVRHRHRAGCVGDLWCVVLHVSVEIKSESQSAFSRGSRLVSDWLFGPTASSGNVPGIDWPEPNGSSEGALRTGRGRSFI